MGELQSRLQQLTEEREGLLGHLHAKAGSLREAERAVANQQAKLAQQQRQAEDAAQASEKVRHAASLPLSPSQQQMSHLTCSIRAWQAILLVTGDLVACMDAGIGGVGTLQVFSHRRCGHTERVWWC